jgi:hypothetical protein
MNWLSSSVNRGCPSHKGRSMEIGPHAGYCLFLEVIIESVVSLAWRGNLVYLPHVMRSHRSSFASNLMESTVTELKIKIIIICYTS